MKRSTAILLAIAVVAAAVPATPVEATRARVCIRESITDVAGDGDIDIAAITVASDCKRLTFTLTTHAPFTDSDLDSWVIAFGPVAYPRVGCNGMTGLIYVVGRPGGGLGSGVQEVSACNNVFGNRPATVRRTSPTSISVSATRTAWDVPLAETFRWQSSTFSTRGSDADSAPRFASIAAVRFVPLRLEATHTTDRRALAVTWNPVMEHHDLIDHFDVQYRNGAGPWLKVNRLGGRERSTELSGLAPGGVYTIRVAAVVRGSRSPWKNVKVRYVTPPSVPQNLRETPSRFGHAIVWDPPASNGGRPISEYQYVALWNGVRIDGVVEARRRTIVIDPRFLPVTYWVRAAPGEVDRSLVPWARIDVTELPPPAG
jgi:hypothetical protein